MDPKAAFTQLDAISHANMPRPPRVRFERRPHLGSFAGLHSSAAVGSCNALRRAYVREAALLESEERFRILVDGVQNYAIFMLDPHGKVVSWNAGAERIKGYKADEIIGQNFSRFYPERTSTKASRKRSFASRQRTAGRNTTLARAEGWITIFRRLGHHGGARLVWEATGLFRDQP